MEKLIFIAVCAVCGMAVAFAQMNRADKNGGASGKSLTSGRHISEADKNAGMSGLKAQLEESKKRTREQNHEK